jgi:hypothetical protein
VKFELTVVMASFFEGELMVVAHGYVVPSFSVAKSTEAVSTSLGDEK